MKSFLVKWKRTGKYGRYTTTITADGCELECDGPTEALAVLKGILMMGGYNPSEISFFMPYSSFTGISRGFLPGVIDGFLQLPIVVRPG